MEIKPPTKAQVERRKGRLRKTNKLPRYRAGQSPEYVNPDDASSDESSESNDDRDETDGNGLVVDDDRSKESESEDGRVAVNDSEDFVNRPDSGANNQHPLFGFGGESYIDAEPEELVSDSSSDEETINFLAIKPTFKAKSEREGLEAQRRKDELREQLERLEEERQMLEKEAETRQMVQETLAAERAEQEAMKQRAALGLVGSDVAVNGEGDVDSHNITVIVSDEIPVEDAVKEYKGWQLRELSRLKRDWIEGMTARFGSDPGTLDKLVKAADEGNVAGLELFRLLLEMEAEASSGRKVVAKGKMGFMQKYYHQGAFYSDVVQHERSFQKDFNAAIGEDRLDKTLLPKILQVRRGDFGKRSRSKYTHLVDQDTTDRTSAWGKSDSAPKLQRREA